MLQVEAKTPWLPLRDVDVDHGTTEGESIASVAEREEGLVSGWAAFGGGWAEVKNSGRRGSGDLIACHRAYFDDLQPRSFSAPTTPFARPTSSSPPIEGPSRPEPAQQLEVNRRPASTCLAPTSLARFRKHSASDARFAATSRQEDQVIRVLGLPIRIGRTVGAPSTPFGSAHPASDGKSVGPASRTRATQR